MSAAAGAVGAPRLALRRVSKSYGPVAALRDVDFEVAAGEVHALVGENGAGKSTLVKVLGGAVRASSGTIALDGREVLVASPAAAARLGIAIVHQDASLVPELTVAENVALGREPRRARWPRLLDRPQMDALARRALAQLGETAIEPGRRVAELGVAARQMVEIARGLARAARVLALDEPTAALTRPETERLFAALARLTAAGTAVIYISHRLEEVFRVAQRITVLRDGAVVRTGAVGEFDRGALVRAMVGRDVEGAELARSGDVADPGGLRALRALNPPLHPSLLEVRGIRGPGVDGVDLTLQAGEVLGIGGLVGAGRSELAQLLFGAVPRTGGTVRLDGREVAPASPRAAIELGFAFLTEDRNRLGLVGALNVRENATLTALGRFRRGPFIARAPEAAAAREMADRLQLTPRDVEAPVGALSGGNRQKVVLARWLLAGARVFLFDEPTAGVDVGAKREIHLLIEELAARGAGVIVISSDLPELLALSDRVLVMRGGRVVGAVERAAATEERVLALALGTGGTA